MCTSLKHCTGRKMWKTRKKLNAGNMIAVFILCAYGFRGPFMWNAAAAARAIPKKRKSTDKIFIICCNIDRRRDSDTIIISARGVWNRCSSTCV